MKNAPTTTTAGDTRIRELEEKVRRLEEENRRLRGQLVLDGTDSKNVAPLLPPPTQATEACPLQRPLGCEGKLSSEEIERYSRQLLLTTGGFGVQGQLKLLQARVLVVGAGGIGSTVLQYLGAAGVGTIGIVDFDVVEMSNLHRQIIHSSHTVGRNKAESARQAVLDLNPTMTCHAIPKAVTVHNVMELVRDYDCIVDASDNPATRYYLNDACCLLDKPLVSGSAVGTEGQCTVYHHKGGPCYRCMYPNPNVQSSCRACSDAGVLGPVPGLIGILQAMEVLKVLTGTGSTLHDRFVMYDATSASFMNIKKPPKHASCAVCGPNPQIRSIQDSHETLRDTRGPAVPASSSSPPQLLPAANSFDVSCREYKASVEVGEPHVLLDVRVAPQFAMCALPHALNIPLAQLPAHVERVRELATATTTGDGPSSNMPVYCICRRGYASVQAAELLRAHGIPSIRNVRGGLVAWQRDVDPSFPKY